MGQHYRTRRSGVDFAPSRLGGAPWRRNCGRGASLADGEWKPGCACGVGETAPGLVLDPFAGSGTTGVVTLEKDRRFFGIEMNPDYCAMAEGRLREAAAQAEQMTLDLEAG